MWRIALLGIPMALALLAFGCGDRQRESGAAEKAGEQTEEAWIPVFRSKAEEKVLDRAKASLQQSGIVYDEDYQMGASWLSVGASKRARALEILGRDRELSPFLITKGPSDD